MDSADKYQKLYECDLLHNHNKDYIYQRSLQMSFFYNSILPDHGYKLGMKIEKLDSLYPNPLFHLYKICLDHIDFVPDDSVLPTTRVIGGPIISSDFLVALNEANGDMKFISGQFFLSDISDEFSINGKDMALFIPYLSMRLFFIGGVDIKFSRKKRKEWVFQGYSKVYERKFVVSVNRKDIDLLHITIQGKP
ncbi:MAG: hypothetical protein QM733_24555 [Ilumatobacteraceae bacterium]